MPFEPCDNNVCPACDICEVLQDLKKDLSIDDAMALVIHCVSVVYDIEVEVGRMPDMPDFDEVVH